MGPSNTVHSYINQATGITAKLQAAGCKFSNSMIILHIIYSLTANYQQLHSSINTATNQQFLTLQWLTQALLQEEATINSFKSQTQPAPTAHTLTADQQPSATKPGGKMNIRNQWAQASGSGQPNSSGQPSSSRGKAKPNCSHCFKPGHTINKCWALHRRPTAAPSKQSGSVKAKANMVHIKTASIAIKSALTSRATPHNREGWLWDSSASSSMMPNISLLHNVRALTKPTQVQLRDRQLIHTSTQGDLHSHINVNDQEIKLFFPSVLHMPKLSQNLLSSNTILNNGYNIHSNHYSFMVQQEEGGASLLIRQMWNGLSYVPLCVKCSAQALSRCTTINVVRRQPNALGKEQSTFITNKKASTNDRPQVLTTKVRDNITPQPHTTTTCMPPTNSTVTTTPVTVERKGVPAKGAGVDSNINNGVIQIAITLSEVHNQFRHISKRRLHQMVNQLADLKLASGSTLSQCAACQLMKSTCRLVLKGLAP
jgi:hypothetical protein